MAYAQVFDRRDQLSLRTGQKQANAEKKGKGKGRKSAKGKKGEEGTGVKKTKEKKLAATKGKPKAKGKPSSPKKGLPKNGRSPKSKLETLAKKRRNENPKQSTSKSRTNSEKKSKKTSQTEVDTSKFQGLQKEIADWVNSNLDVNSTLDEFKAQIKAAQTKFEYFRLNIYWQRRGVFQAACGLTMRVLGEDGKSSTTDVAYFKFEKSHRGLAVAIACAEHVVPRICILAALNFPARIHTLMENQFLHVTCSLRPDLLFISGWDGLC